jgi:hypothetical protein
MELWVMLYRSKEAYEMDAADLLKLLFDARAHNAAQGITGLLLHHGGRFMQVLEGPREAVQGLYRRIAQDARQLDPVVEIDQAADVRLFPDWSMGFAEAPRLRGRTPLGGVESEREAEELLDALAPRSRTAARMLHFLQEDPAHGAVSL